MFILLFVIIKDLGHHLQEYVPNAFFKTYLPPQKKLSSFLYYLISYLIPWLQKVHCCTSVITLFLCIQSCTALGFCSAFHCGIYSSFASVLESRSVLFSFIIWRLSLQVSLQLIFCCLQVVLAVDKLLIS